MGDARSSGENRAQNTRRGEDPLPLRRAGEVHADAPSASCQSSARMGEGGPDNRNALAAKIADEGALR